MSCENNRSTKVTDCLLFGIKGFQATQLSNNKDIDGYTISSYHTMYKHEYVENELTLIYVFASM